MSSISEADEKGMVGEKYVPLLEDVHQAECMQDPVDRQIGGVEPVDPALEGYLHLSLRIPGYFVSPMQRAVMQPLDGVALPASR